MPPAPSLTIVCFGDSLTAGFQSPTPDNPAGHPTPYGTIVQEQLGTAARVITTGICGELTQEMVLRFSGDALQYRPQAVAILGGTNDLGWNTEIQEIMRNLVTLYERAQAAHAIPIPITVPSIRIDDTDASPDAKAFLAHHLDRRAILNRLIVDYAVAHGLPYFDLFEATADPETRMLAAAYSNDGLHFSTEGYRHFGRQFHEQAIAPHLAQWQARLQA